MKRLIVLVIAMTLFGSMGCGRSAELAQTSFDKGMQGENDVRLALFVKGWGMNRALSTESRQKWEARAQVKLYKAAAANGGSLTAEEAEAIVSELSKNVGDDEPTSSANFAYLAYALVLGERADAWLANVDIFVESKKPVWQQISRTARMGAHNVVDEAKGWAPIVQNFKDLIPDSWKTAAITLLQAAPTK